MPGTHQNAAAPGRVFRGLRCAVSVASKGPGTAPAAPKARARGKPQGAAATPAQGAARRTRTPLAHGQMGDTSTPSRRSISAQQRTRSALGILGMTQITVLPVSGSGGVTNASGPCGLSRGSTSRCSAGRPSPRRVSPRSNTQRPDPHRPTRA